MAYPTTCNRCARVFDSKSKKRLYCPKCLKIVLSQNAKDRDLNGIGNRAYSTQQAKKRAGDGKEKRLIDANALKVKGFADPETGEGIVYVQDIDEAPTVDAVEVVRCKECKYYADYGRVWDCVVYGGLSLPDENDFCSLGERKADS